MRLLNLELLDRIDGRIDHQVVEQLIGDLDTVEQVDVVARSLTADIRQRTCLLQRIASRTAGRKDDGIAQLREGEKVASVERNLDDLVCCR